MLPVDCYDALVDAVPHDKDAPRRDHDERLSDFYGRYTHDEGNNYRDALLCEHANEQHIVVCSRNGKLSEMENTHWFRVSYEKFQRHFFLP